nr:unnamed protein product [uncultured bacterium]
MEDKTIINQLPKQQRKVYNVLSKGGKYSVADISIITHCCDPRGHIAEMRNKGIQIKDEWVTEGEIRFKKYFI